MICHVIGFFYGLGSGNQAVSVAFFNHSHQIPYDLGKVLCESIDVSHLSQKIFIRKSANFLI
jgi:hypothetical protein